MTKTTSMGADSPWPLVRLADVACTSSGGTPPRSVASYYHGDIYWAKIEDITRSGMWIRDTAERISEAAIKETNAQVFPARTVFFAMYASIGATSITAVPMSCNQAILGCECTANLYPEFLYYWFCHKRASLLSRGRGGTQANLNAAMVNALHIPLPPLAEQRRIAGVLREQMATVEKARAAAQTRLEAVKSLPAAFLRQVFPQSGQSLPDGWRWVKLGEVCERIDYGFTASAAPNIDYPKFLRITDIQDGKVDWLIVPGCDIPASQEIEYKLRDGDIVFARTGATTGKSFLLREPPRSVFASYLIRLRGAPHEVIADFLGAFFLSNGYWEQVSAGVRGGAQGGFNASMLKKLTVPLPPLSEQRRIAGVLREQMAAVEKARASSEAELNTINALPAALLHRAFNGEL